MRSLRFILPCIVAVLLMIAPSALGATSITDRLSPNKTAVEITSVPTGTTQIGVAVMKTPGGEGLKEGINVASTETALKPGVGKLPAGYPVIDVIARSSTGSALGSWAGRLQTVPGGGETKRQELEKRIATSEALATKLGGEKSAAEALVAKLAVELTSAQAALQKLRAELSELPKEEPPVEPPLEEPIHEEPQTGSFLPGLNAGYWSSSEYSDLHTLAAGHPFIVRLDDPPALTPWEAPGLVKVDALFHGPYSSAGVSGVNHKAYVEGVVNFIKANPHVWAIEVLNEPGGSWFWGSSSESSANRESYAHLLIEVHEALMANFGAIRPLELASWDGGHDSSNAWGEAWSKVPGALADVDGVTSHPYGGTGSPTGESGGIYGNRNLVKSAHEHSGKPVYVTEVGFPTKEQTGDSRKYSETEQAWALYHFMEWARATDYVMNVDFYGYRGDNYGIETQAGVQKKAWTALEEFSAGAACTVCN